MREDALVCWFDELDLAGIALVGGKKFEPTASSTIR